MGAAVSAVVTAQAIATVGLIVVALITAASTRANGRHIASVSGDVAEIRNQTQNSHTSNMRDDMDGKHAELVEGIRQLRSEVGTIHGDIGAVRGDLRGLHRDITGLHEADADQMAALRQAVEEREAAIAAVRREVTAKVAAHALGCPLIHVDPEAG